MNLLAIVLSLLNAIAAVVQPAPPRGGPAAARKLTVIYTASAKGQVRSCNCTKFRFGGYGRQMSLLKTIRRDSPEVVLIEGGDCVEWINPQSDLKTDVTIRALKLLRYDVMVPGEDELGRHGARIIERFKAEGVPVVCANITREDKKGPAYRASAVIKTRAGLKVGVIGLVDSGVERLFQQGDIDRIVSDPMAALKPLAKKLSAASDIVILVYHGPTDTAERFAEVKGINIILATHRTAREVIFPAKPDNEVAAPVKWLGGVPLVNAETKSNWCLGRIDVEIAQGRKIASVNHKLIYLDRRYDEDPEMVKVYDRYNERVKRSVLTASAKIKQEMEALLSGRGMNLVEMRKRLHVSPFATAEKCRDCHAETHAKWSTSRHAKAVSTLAGTDQEYDPECIGCHATGATVRSGFANVKDTPHLANVQCEACHGPGLKHTQSPAKGYGKVEEQTCRSCHTDERTPEFDFEASCAKVKH